MQLDKKMGTLTAHGSGEPLPARTSPGWSSREKGSSHSERFPEAVCRRSTDAII